MASENTKAILVTGSGGAVAVTQFIAVKQLVDKTTSVKPLGSFSSTMFKGLNEWTTMASLLGGVASLGYVIYQMEKGTTVGFKPDSWLIRSNFTGSRNNQCNPRPTGYNGCNDKPEQPF